MTLQARECSPSFLEHVWDYDIGQIAVIVECQGVQPPVHRIIEVNVAILDVGVRFNEHSAGCTSLLELEPDHADQLLKFCLEVFGTGVHDLLPILTQALTGDVPLHLDHDTARDLRADKSGKVERFYILTQPACFVEIQLIPLVQGIHHIC